MSTIEATKKVEVIELITKNPNITNKDVGKLLGVTTNQVSSVRHWYSKKGSAYLTKIQNERDSILNLFKTYTDEFLNKGGVEKQKARGVMLNYVGKSKARKGDILTLPCSDWFMEEMINNKVSNKFSYVACERDMGTLVKMTQKMHLYGQKNEIYHGEIGEKMMTAVENQYEHILADYCGTLNKIKKEIIYACTNNIVKVDGTICVTLFKCRTFGESINKLNRFKNEMSGTNVKLNDNESAIKMFFKSLASITDFEVVDELCYGDTSPMILIVLKRTK